MALACFGEVAAGSDVPLPDVVPSGTVGAGEAFQIHRKWGRFNSIVGGHDRFHLESDRWPDSVDVSFLEGYARALVGVCALLGGS